MQHALDCRYGRKNSWFSVLPDRALPLMQASPTIGLDLSSRALVWENSRGKPWIAYDDPQDLLKRPGCPLSSSNALLP